MKQLALILAVVFLIIAILYWTGLMPAIPGVSSSGVHVKHGILAVILALLCLVWFRFQSASTVR